MDGLDWPTWCAPAYPQQAGEWAIPETEVSPEIRPSHDTCPEKTYDLICQPSLLRLPSCAALNTGFIKVDDAPVSPFLEEWNGDKICPLYDEEDKDGSDRKLPNPDFAFAPSPPTTVEENQSSHHALSSTKKRGRTATDVTMYTSRTDIYVNPPALCDAAEEKEMARPPKLAKSGEASTQLDTVDLERVAASPQTVTRGVGDAVKADDADVCLVHVVRRGYTATLCRARNGKFVSRRAKPLQADVGASVSETQQQQQHHLQLVKGKTKVVEATTAAAEGEEKADPALPWTLTFAQAPIVKEKGGRPRKWTMCAISSLCKPFCIMMQKAPLGAQVHQEMIVSQLGNVPLRRAQELLDILVGVGVVMRPFRGVYSWYGMMGVAPTLGDVVQIKRDTSIHKLGNTMLSRVVRWIVREVLVTFQGSCLRKEVAKKLKNLILKEHLPRTWSCRLDACIRICEEVGLLTSTNTGTRCRLTWCGTGDCSRVSLLTAPIPHHPSLSLAASRKKKIR